MRARAAAGGLGGSWRVLLFNDRFNTRKRVEEALGWADRSIAIRPTFANHMTKARLYYALDDPQAAAAVETEAYQLATEEEVRAYARARRRAGQTAEADAILERIDEIP